MSQPPYGVPPQHGAPQGHPGQPQPPAYGQPGQAAPPPAYLGGGAPAGPPQFQGGPPAYGGAPQQGGGLRGLAPASKPRRIGLIMGLLTALALIGFVVLVALITLNN
ncbi:MULTISPECIES: hypothetical protein [unclassified Nocardioides]|uniref:hypothetical protein n=1 Tax=unclassified Nocardioides TaxID=2615069 RepID=UPI0006FA66F3|nr:MULTISPECIES: hypothetical protein [unclassified Nocardioides]KRA38762.1 hypothetical protein ASD81_09205 [Nocardioides sp. Root614]KRA92722.1 hypothetical protein ASD84_09470 [Nocardioides sp. Root682]